MDRKNGKNDFKGNVFEIDAARQKRSKESNPNPKGYKQWFKNSKLSQYAATDWLKFIILMVGTWFFMRTCGRIPSF